LFQAGGERRHRFIASISNSLNTFEINRFPRPVNAQRFIQII
jgi:hypothetical protein